MGGRGSFIKEGGFTMQRYKTVGFIDGIKILRPVDPNHRLSLPERSGSPNASYVSYNDDGSFRQFITFDDDRMPRYQIDYGKHKDRISLHVHIYKDGNRDWGFRYLYPGDDLYDRHKKLFVGVPIPN